MMRFYLLLIVGLCTAPRVEADAWCGKGWKWVKASGGCARAHTSAPTTAPTPAPTPTPPTPHPTPVWTAPPRTKWTPPPQATMHPTPSPTPTAKQSPAPTPQETWKLHGTGLAGGTVHVQDEMSAMTSALSHTKKSQPKSTIKRLWNRLFGMGKAEDAANEHKAHLTQMRRQQEDMRRQAERRAFMGQQRKNSNAMQSQHSQLQRLQRQAAALRARKAAMLRAPHAAAPAPSSLETLRAMRDKLLQRKAVMRQKQLLQAINSPPVMPPMGGEETAGTVVNAPPGGGAAITYAASPPGGGQR